MCCRPRHSNHTGDHCCAERFLGDGFGGRATICGRLRRSLSHAGALPGHADHAIPRHTRPVRHGLLNGCTASAALERMDLVSVELVSGGNGIDRATLTAFTEVVVRTAFPSSVQKRCRWSVPMQSWKIGTVMAQVCDGSVVKQLPLPRDSTMVFESRSRSSASTCQNCVNPPVPPL